MLRKQRRFAQLLLNHEEQDHSVEMEHVVIRKENVLVKNFR